jgi:hypothetical protein
MQAYIKDTKALADAQASLAEAQKTGDEVAIAYAQEKVDLAQVKANKDKETLDLITQQNTLTLGSATGTTSSAAAALAASKGGGAGGLAGLLGGMGGANKLKMGADPFGLNEMKNNIQGIVDGISAILSKFGADVKFQFDNARMLIQPIWDGMWRDIHAALDKYMPEINKNLHTAFANMELWWTNHKLAIQTIWDALLIGMAPVLREKTTMLTVGLMQWGVIFSGFFAMYMQQMNDDWKGLWLTLIDTLVNLFGPDFTKKLFGVVNPILKWMNDRIEDLSSALEKLKSILGDVQEQGTKAGAIGAGGRAGTYPDHAGGGPVMAGQGGWVGEYGPEYFRPNVPGTIYNSWNVNISSAQSTNSLVGDLALVRILAGA